MSAVENLAVLPELPVLLVWGDRDPILPVAHGRRAVDLLPSARLVVFPGCGHEPQRWDPARMADLLVPFSELVFTTVGCSPRLPQLAFAELIDRGELDRHLRKARAIYRRPIFGRPYLFGEVVVGYSWPREEVEKDREGSATLGFGVELLFGRDPY